ncbi:2-oxoglutarate dehydrogenase E1 component [Sedimenticola selenatireducens]|uniref:2-oxoglutarate dehydrogenase E1 component n=1 Tax=Sedimenticola selenatireducens TaxID=191960 RepID=A0A558E0J9_9GAMM|nr:2-oxoglutarate dehydrogenase E1 component [Sedimenticola selenatireducens]TVO75265.1 2-oxoglutarate dehydrogenase E1 component [Sedimenticola selenatireducens]TVT66882.1 MAG: 2-oxoglutarate dehydrogenase E1 component [Sedimenticola selenatireducens]
MSALLELLRTTSALSGGNAAFIEDLYERYLQDPNSVDPAWRKRFDSIIKDSANEAPDIAHGPVRSNFARLAREKRPALRQASERMSPGAAEKQAAVLRLINAWRVRGHQYATLDPLKLRDVEDVPDLDPAFHRLGEADMDTVFNTGSLFAPDRMPLREIISFIKDVYGSNVGAEYMHITDTRQKRWIQKRVEGNRAKADLSTDDKKWLLTLLTAAEGLEKYLHTRYVGQKRFSLEGGESLIPLMDELIQRGGQDGIREVAIGMAHRGRLNVLTNILGKAPAELFDEFEGKKTPELYKSSGDVKYHMGFSTDIETPSGFSHVVLGFNPSHLEIISPVIEGSVRARQQRRGDRDGSEVLPILIHGDSAFAGQGVVMETFQMSQARGYTTGGSVHIVINNQVGFTTSNPLDTRSTLYCTDVAKIVQAPIFHVNGDDPEAVIFVTRLAMDYRQRFHKDVIIDLICYRRHGHNEADEPAMTQPMMYQKIRRLPTTRSNYSDQLISEGIITPDQSREMVEDYRSSLEQNNAVARPTLTDLNYPYHVNWAPYHHISWEHIVDTSVSEERLAHLSARLVAAPDGFETHARVTKLIEGRRKMATGDQLVDWGFGECLAYASLVEEGIPVRLSGQDCGRGTFSHRHAVLHNQLTGESHTPLQHISEDQANFLVIDSLLSEEAVLGFEYGYATTEPKSLTIWEAQFGDFANGAQVVIDQFISSGGSKWGLYCGLVMLLPHGYEGQGAEHSSARLERYLQLCAEHNMQVCVPTTPAQVFHMLRRQMLRPMRKPLVVMSPKSLLRHRLATSALEEFTKGGFQSVIGEIDDINPDDVEHIVICSGKVYYELLEARRARGLKNVALIRLEQLYPFPREIFDEIIDQYTKVDRLIWCQEEPQNQGAWDQIKHRFHTQLDKGKHLYYVGRPAAAAPAVGFYPIHVQQQETLIDEALTGRINPSMNRRMPA